MSGYRAGKLFYEALLNPQLTAEFQTAPEAVLERYQLSEAEKTAIRNKDVRYLYEIGVPPLLLQRASGRLLGLQMGEYQAALAGIVPFWRRTAGERSS